MRRPHAASVVVVGTVDTHRPAPLQSTVLELARGLQDREMCGRRVEARPVLLADPGTDDDRPVSLRLKALSAGLAAVVRDVRPDVVHTLSAPAGLAALSVVPSGTPLVHSPLGRLRSGGGAGADDLARLERLLLREADRVVASSGSEADVLVALGRDRRRIDLVPYAVPAGFVPHGPKLAKPDGVLRVVTVSRSLAPASGVDAVLDAVHGVRGVELVVAGGPHPARLDDDPEAVRVLEHARRLGVATRLLGHLPHDDLPAVLRSADLVVVPPRWGATGAVAVEAMACGAPVVVTAGSGGDADAVVEGMTGVIVTGDDPARLRREVRDLLEDSMRRSGYTMAARARVAARHDWDAVSSHLLSAYAGGAAAPVPVPSH